MRSGQVRLACVVGLVFLVVPSLASAHSLPKARTVGERCAPGPAPPPGGEQAAKRTPWDAVVVAPPSPTINEAQIGIWQSALGLSCALWARLIDPERGVIVPSAAYAPQMWTRDAFWIALATGEVQTNHRVLQRLAALQAPSGQIPTWIVPDAPAGTPRVVFSGDESTLLYLIWADILQSAPGNWTPPRATLLRALAYLRAHSDAQGSFWSAVGTGASWEDGVVVARPDVLAYTQGLAVTALECAADLGLGVTPAEIADARAAYGDLARPWPAQWAAGGGRWRGLVASPLVVAPTAGSGHHYLPFSARHDERDPSVLVGSFLSSWLFGDALLDRDVIQDTLASLCGSAFGYRTMCPRGGGYLAAGAFRQSREPGDYQNGGSWVLYDGLALAAGALNGVRGAKDAFWARLGGEMAGPDPFGEYRQTRVALPYYGSEPPVRHGYGWDSYLVVAALFVMTTP